MTPDLYWVPGPWRGKLAVSARPRGGDWLEDEVAGWRNAGLHTIVSLLEDDEVRQLGLDSESRIAESTGLQFVSLPIPDRGVPASVGGSLQVLTHIATALESGKNVAIHCRQGVGRSGLVAAALLLVSGRPVGEAVDAVSRARGLRVPETTSQVMWLRQLAAQSPVPAH